MTPAPEFIDKDGRRFEIRHQPRGLVWLLWWKSPTASLRIGEFASVEVARYCLGKIIPTTDLDAMARASVAPFARTFAEAH